MFSKWLTIGIGIKRWVVLLLLAITLFAIGGANGMTHLNNSPNRLPLLSQSWAETIGTVLAGVLIGGIALLKLANNILAPYRRYQHGRVIDVVYAHSKRQKGIKVVAIGGGTGLPAILRGLKSHTSNLTAIVTVADDGGSSGRLRREMGVLPPGDIRNNIAALADDESLMTQLFQYRFQQGALRGHAFGNLFIAALSGVSGGLENALPEVERVLNIQGRVLPSTLDDINLVAWVRIPGKSRSVRICGESKISKSGGQIETISLIPENVTAYEMSVQSILDADLIAIGPGSLYTSILPNLLVPGISGALRQTQARKVYICNVATQPGETEGYTVAEHIMALEDCLGRGVLQTVIANNATPIRNAGSNTHYVQPIPANHNILQRYEVMYTDLVDVERPWRHDPHKLAGAILTLMSEERTRTGNGASSVYLKTNS